MGGRVPVPRAWGAPGGPAGGPRLPAPHRPPGQRDPALQDGGQGRNHFLLRLIRTSHTFNFYNYFVGGGGGKKLYRYICINIPYQKAKMQCTLYVRVHGVNPIPSL